jgi:hypothetical protein
LLPQDLHRETKEIDMFRLAKASSTLIDDEKVESTD